MFSMTLLKELGYNKLKSIVITFLLRNNCVIMFLKPIKALQKAPILTPSPHGPKNRQNRSVNRARRQLRLSESEK